MKFNKSYQQQDVSGGHGKLHIPPPKAEHSPRSLKHIPCPTWTQW